MIEENNEISNNTLKNIGKEIAKEIKEVHRNQNEYITSLDEENMTNIISPPLSILLAFIDNSLNENSLPSIWNIITNKVTKMYSTLQIALAFSIYRKELINTLYNFGVTCSYGEYLRFTTCAGVAN